jgi:hypothetical protein
VPRLGKGEAFAKGKGGRLAEAPATALDAEGKVGAFLGKGKGGRGGKGVTGGAPATWQVR